VVNLNLEQYYPDKWRVNRLDVNKLNVYYDECAKRVRNPLDRKYTLTHSDLTTELFLDIRCDFAYDKTNEIRDEVLGEWKIIDNQPVSYLTIYVDSGEYSDLDKNIRYMIFKRELPLAIEAIVYGDKKLYEAYPKLLNAPIIVNFQSDDPNINGEANFGTVRDYL